MAGRILVIEDDPASLELLKYLLERAGHSVRGAPDGATGLRAAFDNAFDLVLCDLQMPELTGYEVIAQLQSSPDWRAVPVIAVTAYSMPGDRESVMAAGFTEYMTKPIDPECFLAHIDRWLALPRQPGSA
ncbi:MAG: response regulator [Steroidobacteraceae bacterium]